MKAWMRSSLRGRRVGMAAKRAAIPGLHRVTKRLASGSFAIYVYRHRGGPLLVRFEGPTRTEAERAEADGTDQLLAAYVSTKAVLRPDDTLRRLTRTFREAPEGLPSLSPSTRKEWSTWLDRIDAAHGDMPIRLLKARGARQHFIEWRDTYADRPRTADYGVQVLRRVFAVAVDRGLLDGNPAEGIRQLYEANRADIIVTDDELAAILPHATAHARYAIRLAAATGLRRGDLVSLRWDDVREDHIELATKKSRGRTFVIAPLVGDGRAVIDELAAARESTITSGRVPSAFVLTSERGTKWLGPSVTQAFIRAAKEAGVDKSLHDLRGTAATRFILQGFNPQEVASFIGWEQKRVDQIIRRYVHAGRIAREAIQRVEAQRASG
jgi:integrase